MSDKKTTEKATGSVSGKTHAPAHAANPKPVHHSAPRVHAPSGPASSPASSASPVRLTKKHKPTFNVLNYGFFKSVKARWRKPRGIDNKKRIRKAWAGASPRIGYRNPPSIRHLHPRGIPEVLVHNAEELSQAHGKLVRFASQIGGRKRALLEAKAKEMGLEVLNLSSPKQPQVK